MKVKYQIFVSSTFEDLKEEREQAIKAILEMGHIPVGMEMFSAGDEEQWKLIQKQIDDCDYYIIIIAHRYGTLDGSISYTEKEYNYAVSKRIPTLGFIIEKSANWPVSKSDTDTNKKKRLDDLKSKVKHKLISYWLNKDDLYGKVSISLMKQFATNPRIGWAKADELTGPEVVSELSRLSKENSDLRKEIERLLLNAKLEEESKYDKVINALKSRKVTLSFYFKNARKWADGEEVTYFEIFKIIASELIIEKSVKDSASYIALILNDNNKRELRDNWPIPSNHVNIIFADFSVLELILPSPKTHSVKDTNNYWTLSEDGQKIYRMIRKEKLFMTDLQDDIPVKND